MQINRTIWLAVDKNGNEHIFDGKPKRKAPIWVLGNGSKKIHVPDGTIKRLVRKNMSWDDLPHPYPGFKKCRVCGDTLPLSKFYHSKKKMANGRIAIIPHSGCKKCDSDSYYRKKKINEHQHNILAGE